MFCEAVTEPEREGSEFLECNGMIYVHITVLKHRIFSVVVMKIEKSAKNQ